MALLGACLGWLAGLGLALALVSPIAAHTVLLGPWLLAGAGALLAAVVARAPAARLVALVAAAAVLGWARGLAALPALADDPLQPYHGPVRLRGVVAAPALPGESWTTVRLDATAVWRDGDWLPARGGVLLRLPRTAPYDYGDRLQVEGDLRPAPAPPASGYGEALRRQGVRAALDYPAVEPLAGQSAPAPLAALYAARQALGRALGAALPEPHAALLVGLLLGGNAAMPADFRQAMQALGLSHLTAVSGFNVTLVAAALTVVAVRLAGRRWAWPLAAAGVVGYTLLVGAPPSAVRAAAMALIALGAEAAGRPRDGLAALLLAAAGLTALDPWLLADLGFQLSALATAGLLLLGPGLQARLRRLPPWAAEGLAATLAAQALVLPLQLATFHTVSPLAPLANVLVVPLVPPLMALGLLLAVGGVVAPSLAAALAVVPWACLELVVRLVRGLAALPGAQLEVGALPPALGLLYLAGLTVLAVGSAPELVGARAALTRWLAAPVARLALAAGAAALALGALAFSARPDGNLRVAVLDVGQGDAALIRTPGGRVVLVDGGPSPATLLAHLGNRLGLAERTIDLVVLTHPHEDHVAGLVEVIERYAVRQVVEGAVDYVSTGAERWRSVLARKQVPAHVGGSRERWQLDDDVWLDLWAVPAEPGSRADQLEPAGALVARLRYGATSLLLPGDLVAEQGHRLLAQGADLRADLVLAPHHGSRSGLDPALLAAIAPRGAVISNGARNRFGHPAPQTLALLQAHGVAVWRTDQHGTIELTSDGSQWTVQAAGAR
ncbi:MAG: ComEC/Rec2 family competence protein [Chloroflexi bacterium]|nr:ComEC/Rec2 family competence protein [Chloroflexota bacterium]